MAEHSADRRSPPARNLDKVLYPETGTTKGEVIDYYTRIAEVMIPHVIGRPVTRKRWPDGVGTPEDDPGMVFFAKDLERGAPVLGAPHADPPLRPGPKDYPLVGDIPTLVYLAQVASLELHVPQWRFAAGRRPRPRRPAWCSTSTPGRAWACRSARSWPAGRADILVDMGLEPYPVTSGSKGIHLYAALPPGQSTEQASALAQRARPRDRGRPPRPRGQQHEEDGTLRARCSSTGARTTGRRRPIAPYSLRGRDAPDGRRAAHVG